MFSSAHILSNSNAYLGVGRKPMILLFLLFIFLSICYYTNIPITRYESK